MFASEGKIRQSQIEDIGNQVSLLTLVTNAVIVWNTYIQAIIDQLEKEGYKVDSSDLFHLSLYRFDYVNKYIRCAKRFTKPKAK